MSVNMSGTAGTDYSDFEYQVAQTSVRIQLDNAGNPRAEGVNNIEVLDGIGGLSNNEVAELVYLEAKPYIEFEDEQGEQTAATTIQTRGTVGINFPASDGLFVESGAKKPGEPFELNNLTESEVTVDHQSQTADEILLPYEHQIIPPVDDRNSGDTIAAGGSRTDSPLYSRNFRQLVGRGPVLDSNDDISVLTNVNAGDVVAAGVEGALRLHMVWDVAETDDAGRAFSVPDGM